MKNTLKRRLPAALLAGCLALSLAGCGGGQSDAAPAPEPTAAAEETAAPDTAPAAEPVQAGINIAAINGLPQDFMRGVDISSLPAELASGVVYYDFDGNEITTVEDFCQLLADCGVTHVRVRVWNDPYDAAGHGYGGGNNDVETAIALAKGCAAAGLRMLVDFHLSDFWADPGKQMAPKAWESFTAAETCDAIGEFIGTALAELEAAAPDVIDMVQVGNETTHGIAGLTGDDDMCAAFTAGIEAVHAFGTDAGRDVRAVIHLTNPEQGTFTSWAKVLDEHGVDYDILATSYYPNWHGTLENLKTELQTVRETYGKDVLVVETSYASSLYETDDYGPLGAGLDGNGDDLSWPFTEQGQATYLRALMGNANNAGALGVFYWEPAWITVGNTLGLTGDALDAQVKANQKIWEEYGSGWASSYAAEYDPKDAGEWYGGSAMDNEGMFGPDGRPLESLRVWSYVYTGAVTDKVSVESIPAPELTLEMDGEAALPRTVGVLYSTGKTVQDPVVWEAAEIDTSAPGEYTVSGTVTFSQTPDRGPYAGQTEAAVTATVKVVPAEVENLLPAADAGFEDGANFTVDGEGVSPIPDKSDPYEGEGSMHWWSETAAGGSAIYTPALSLAAGQYVFSAQAQGLDGDTVTLEVLDAASGEVLAASDPAVMAGWIVWQKPTVLFTLDADTDVQLRVTVVMQDGGWGTCDALSLGAVA